MRIKTQTQRMMKAIFIVASLVAVNAVVSAQELRRDPTTNGGGTVKVGITSALGHELPYVGGYGGYVLPSGIFLGGGGMNAWGRLPDRAGTVVKGGFGFGGLSVGYWPYRGQRLQPMVHCLFGGGGYTLEEPLSDGTFRREREGGWVMEPEAGLRVKIHEHVWLVPAVSYRLARFGERDLGGYGVLFSVLVGGFGSQAAVR